MAFQLQNFYEDTLSGGIGSNDLIIPINNPPSVSEGWLLIDWDIPSQREFVYFTNRTATTVTLPSVSNRGVDGTTARSHAQGAKVRMNVNAAMLAGLRDGTGLAPFTNSQYADNSISTSKVQDGSITPAKMVGTDLFGIGPALVGTAPQAGTGQFYTQAATNVVTTNGTGNGTVTFPTPFPNGLLTVIATNGDGAFVVNPITSGIAASGFNIVCGNNNASVRVNWIAIGF